jgi:transposase
MEKKGQKKKRRKEKILITLSDEEVAYLKNTVKKGESNARVITRARILLLSHKGKTNKEITEALDCSHDMIHLVRKRYKDRGSSDKAIHDAPRPGQPKKITAEHEAFVVATACTDAPEGHGHWTLEALRGKLTETYEELTSVSHERIRHILLRSALKPWREKNVVRSKAHA